MPKALCVAVAVVGIVMAPAVCWAQGVARPIVAPEETLVPGWRGSAITASLNLGGYRLPPERGATVKAVTMHVYVVGGGGAGSTVIRITDGTNVCDASFSCSATDLTGTASAGAKRVSVSGACSFPPGASLVMSVNATTCTSTQPSVTTVSAVGRWN